MFLPSTAAMRSADRLLSWLPGLRLLAGYRRADLKPDLVAALVVTLVLIPAAIAYADLARMPPVAGLYASLGGMLVFALLSSSRHVIVGPDAAIALLVGAAVSPLAGGDPGKAIALSSGLALLTGGLLLLAARFRLGAAADFLSSPVMLGFLNGAAVVIVASQIGKFSGIALHEDNSLLRFLEFAHRLPGEVHTPTLAVGLAAVAVLFIARRWLPKLPGPVLVFALALVVGRLVDCQSYGMAVIGAVDTRLPVPTAAGLSLPEFGQLLTAAIGLAFLIFPEGVLLGRAVASRHGYDIDPNRELLALGIANVATGTLNSFAVGASQTRTLLNDQSGGRTQMVGLLAAGLLVVFIYFLGAWIATLPTVAIAAILVYTGITLVDVGAVRELLRRHRASGWLSLLTAAGVIAFGVLPGILFGIVLSLVMLLGELVRPQDALLGRVEGAGSLHDIGDDEQACTLPGLVAYRFYGPLMFANVRYFIDRLEAFIARERSPVRQVIIDARAIPSIDVTAAEQLWPFLDRLQARGIAIVVTKAHLPLRQALQALRVQDEVRGPVRYYEQLADAVADFEAGKADGKG